MRSPQSSCASVARPQLVVGGGIATMRTVLEALKDNRPVVVLPDSGDAALEIYEVCFKQKEDEGYSDPPSLSKRNEGARNEARPLLKEIQKRGRTKTGVNQ